MARPIDLAMAEERPAKTTIRSIWLNHIIAAHQATGPTKHPLYLTLSGAEGRDIELLLQHRIISKTAAGNIAQSDQLRVVAVEKSKLSVLALQRKYPGLKILEVPFESLLCGDNPTSWPGPNHELLCRAHVVNLDLNGSLSYRDEAGQISFPQLAWIEKLAQLHAKPPRLDWILCLTLSAAINCPANVWECIGAFLKENCQREPAFQKACQTTLGNELMSTVEGERFAELAQCSQIDKQHILMAFVPKKIAHLIHRQGWLVRTTTNLRYGGTAKEAAMVTWVVKLTTDSRAAGKPDSLYLECVRSILEQAGAINDDGSVKKL